MVADPVSGVGALLPRPEGDDGPGRQQARDGGVERQAPGAEPLGLLGDGADQEGRTVQLKVQPAEVEAAELGGVAGAEGQAPHLGRRRAGIEGQPGAGRAERQLQPLGPGPAAGRRDPGLPFHVEIRLGGGRGEALDQHVARPGVEGGLHQAGVECGRLSP